MGRREKDDTLRLALALGNALQDAGVPVLYTRTTDIYQSPSEKADMANRSEADFFISLHRNAMPVPGTASGALSLVYEKGDEAEQIANQIQQYMAAVGFQDLGVTERPNLTVLHRTRMPAVLVEAGFIDNPADNWIFDNRLEQMAKGIADGILSGFTEVSQPIYYMVQTGAFRNKEWADQMEQKLQEQGFPVWQTAEDGWYKVRVGAFLNMDNAVRMEQVLRQYGYSTHMVKSVQRSSSAGQANGQTG